MKVNYSDRIIITFAIIFTIAFVSVGSFTLYNAYNNIDQAVETNIKNVAIIVAADDTVVHLLKTKDFILNDHIESRYGETEDIAYIVVIDMDSVRYSHPDISKVGKTFVGGDEDKVIDEGVTYFSSSTGTLGASKRVFVPIFDEDSQIGAVSVGNLDSTIKVLKTKQTIYILSGFSVGLVLSIIGLVWVSKEFKKDLLGFTPSEIAMLYSENKSLIEQLSEGIITVDREYKITTINDACKRMFRLTENHKYQNVIEVFPHINFKEIMLTQKHTDNKLMEINNEKLLLSSFPLYSDNEVIGATVIFRSRLEVDMLLDQISGYRKISKALREQKHEFQNKLHVILGLIKMKDFETVDNYINQNIYTTNLTSDYYSSRIKDDKISALFVGKDIQSKEYDTSVQLTSDSNLSKNHNPISSDDLIIVIGNLIDNSFEAFSGKNIDNKKIGVKIVDSEDQILIGVSNNAGGIDPVIRNRMFKRGVSSKKGDNRGTGLSLINEIVNLYGGSKQVQSSSRKTYIEIILKKVKV